MVYIFAPLIVLLLNILDGVKLPSKIPKYINLVVFEGN